MMMLLAIRNFLYKPWRSALLFFGLGLGVSVMIILLSIGDAMVVQSEQERLVGGGSITVLPEGIDIEVMKTGGLGGLFFSIANARFLNLQLLGAPRLAPFVRAVAPQIDEQLVYLRTPDGVERPVRASADIPSAQRAVGAAPTLAAGQDLHGQVLITTHEQVGGRDRQRRFTVTVPPSEVRFSTTAAELHVGASS